MKILRFSLPLLIVLMLAQVSLGQTQIRRGKVLYPSLRPQAAEMVKAARTGDFEKFADYMAPQVIEYIGGREKFIELTKRSLDETESAGLKIINYVTGKPTQILKDGKTIFAVLPTKVTMKMSGRRIINDGSVLGISIDNGKNWKFIRVESKEAVKRFFPETIDKLKFPPTTIS